MKPSTLSLFAFLSALAPSLAFAHPGGHSLTCKLPDASGASAKQVTQFTLHRSNGTGWYAPEFSVTVGGKTYEIKPTDDAKNYGETIHDAPLGLIFVSADNTDQGDATQLSASVKAIPASVKAFDNDGNRVQWTLDGEKDECSDSNGRATFQAVFRGFLFLDNASNSNEKILELDTELLDCELTYNSGMAC